MLSFFVVTCWSAIPELDLIEIHGRWSIPDHEKVSGGFVIHISNKGWVLNNNMTVVKSSASFQKHPEFKKFERTEVYWGAIIAKRELFFFHIWPEQSPEFESELAQSLTSVGVELHDDWDIFARADEYIRARVRKLSDNFAMNSFGISLIPDMAQTEPFSTMIGVNGTMIHSDVSICLTGYVFDLKQFLIEQNIFLVLAALALTLNWIGWSSIEKQTRESRFCAQLSVHSFIAHLAFETGYQLFLMGFERKSKQIESLFIVLILAHIAVYLAIPMRTIVRIWMESHASHEIVTTLSIFFCEMCVVQNVVSIGLALMRFVPIPILFISYSTFIPQIIYTFQHPFLQRKNDSVFVVCITLSRLFPLFYFGQYSRNFLAVKPSVMYWLVAIYALGQMVVILMQNHGLLKGWVYETYNYYQIPPPGATCPICLNPIEELQEAMITPCGHSFHRTCLLTWMNEKLLCPVCRTELPVVPDLVDTHI